MCGRAVRTPRCARFSTPPWRSLPGPPAEAAALALCSLFLPPQRSPGCRGFAQAPRLMRFRPERIFAGYGRNSRTKLRPFVNTKKIAV